MRQRLGVAPCLLSDPELLILDEPMNGLETTAWPFRNLIRELVGKGRTVLLSSHLLDEVEKTCDIVAIVDEGRIVAQGPIHEIVRGGPRAIDIVVDSAVEAASAARRRAGCRARHRQWRAARDPQPEAPVDREIVTAVLRRLLDHGVDVERRHSGWYPDAEPPTHQDRSAQARRRPAVFLGLTLGLLALAYLVTAIQHGGNPAEYDAAGGLELSDSLSSSR